jgi:hypothetical protein
LAALADEVAFQLTRSMTYEDAAAKLAVSSNAVLKAVKAHLRRKRAAQA